MGRISKEEAARFSGAAWALRLCEENGVEACRKELEMRGILNIPLKASKKDIDEFVEKSKKNTIATVLLMAAATLRDEYGFGTDRLSRFIKRFNNKTACLIDQFVYWKDLQKTIQDETGIFIEIPDEFIQERSNG